MIAKKVSFQNKKFKNEVFLNYGNAVSYPEKARINIVINYLSIY